MNINQQIPERNKMRAPIDYEALRAGIMGGDMIQLAKALTLVENKKLAFSPELLHFLSSLDSDKKTLRIAISGPPGAGKSTFIEQLGLKLIENGHKVAVLAIDPSSENTKGSILGDKTRMEKLSKSENAFIRPSANVLEQGGIRSSSYDAIKVCEAAGYNIIIIETVGVGQSEIQVTRITDLLYLLLSPGGGDELQGLKKGIVEMADQIIINKADGELMATAEQMKKEYRNAIHLSRKQSTPFPPRKVITVSALNDSNMEHFPAEIDSILESEEISNYIREHRKIQDAAWFKIKAQELIYHLITKNSQFNSAVDELAKREDIYQSLIELNQRFDNIIS
ncbi:methylmalonyl Co-A mutase-associated GTPase MeaB [Portibacter lacus]|uniref:ATPase/protein kinase n=1 Tax=Portibacter lacus TaxID=1099794 RepID=A0AA37WEP5_9BACT|nr:methylmalonyl Co-A mutase-associated GTPase MeaB [Portibacter lacus]GLR16874.1 ATPase/protein kinase [Portibacter lacus]